MTKAFQSNVKKNIVNDSILLIEKNETVRSFLLLRFAVARRDDTQRGVTRENTGIIQMIVLIVSLRHQKGVKYNSIGSFQK